MNQGQGVGNEDDAAFLSSVPRRPGVAVVERDVYKPGNLSRRPASPPRNLILVLGHKRREDRTDFATKIIKEGMLAESIGKMASPGAECPREADVASFEPIERVPVTKLGLNRAKARMSVMYRA